MNKQIKLKLKVYYTPNLILSSSSHISWYAVSNFLNSLAEYKRLLRKMYECSEFGLEFGGIFQIGNW